MLEFEQLWASTFLGNDISPIHAMLHGGCVLRSPNVRADLLVK